MKHTYLKSLNFRLIVYCLLFLGVLFIIHSFKKTIQKRNKQRRLTHSVQCFIGLYQMVALQGFIQKKTAGVLLRIMRP